MSAKFESEQQRVVQILNEAKAESVGFVLQTYLDSFCEGFAVLEEVTHIKRAKYKRSVPEEI